MNQGIKVIHPAQRSTATAQTGGMRREAAISPELTGSQTIWMGLVTTPAGDHGGWHPTHQHAIHFHPRNQRVGVLMRRHHGDCESAIYVVSGRARFRWGSGGNDSAEVSAGDFLSVPPNVIHHEQALGDEPFVMVVARGCANTITVNVDGPDS